MLAQIVAKTAKDSDSDPHFLRGLLIYEANPSEVKIGRSLIESVIHGEFLMIQNRIIYGLRGVWTHWTLCCLRVTQTRITPILSGRDAAKLKEAGNAHRDRKCAWLRWMIPPRLTVHFPAQWPSQLCGPFIDTAAPVIDAALRASIHYLDVAAEQAAVLAVFERFANAARDAGVVSLPPWRSLGDWATSCPLPLWGSGMRRTKSASQSRSTVGSRR